MFSRASSILVLVLPLLATATVLPRNDGSQCDSGSTQCCQSQVAVSVSINRSSECANSFVPQQPTTQSIQWLLAIIGVSAGSLVGTVGRKL